MDAKEKLMQKALGTYPMYECCWCGERKYIEEFNLYNPLTHYDELSRRLVLICIKCYRIHSVFKIPKEFIDGVRYGRREEPK